MYVSTIYVAETRNTSMEEASERHAVDRITRHCVQKRKIRFILEGESINSVVKDAEIDSSVKPGGQEMMVSVFSLCRTWISKWKMCVYEPSCRHYGSASR